MSKLNLPKRVVNHLESCNNVHRYGKRWRKFIKYMEERGFTFVDCGWSAGFYGKDAALSYQLCGQADKRVDLCILASETDNRITILHHEMLISSSTRLFDAHLKIEQVICDYVSKWPAFSDTFVFTSRRDKAADDRAEKIIAKEAEKIEARLERVCTRWRASIEDRQNLQLRFGKKKDAAGFVHDYNGRGWRGDTTATIASDDGKSVQVNSAGHERLPACGY